MTTSMLLLSMTLLAPGKAPDLEWLAGCWRGDGADGFAALEAWFPVPGTGHWIGLSYRVRDGEGFHEFLEILRDGDRWVYRAHVPAQEPTDFALSDWGAGYASFLNPDHDFPQRIVYRREGPELVATISRADGSGARDFSWRRSPCETPATLEEKLPPAAPATPGQ